MIHKKEQSKTQLLKCVTVKNPDQKIMASTVKHKTNYIY